MTTYTQNMTQKGYTGTHSILEDIERQVDLVDCLLVVDLFPQCTECLLDGKLLVLWDEFSEALHDLLKVFLCQ